MSPASAACRSYRHMVASSQQLRMVCASRETAVCRTCVHEDSSQPAAIVDRLFVDCQVSMMTQKPQADLRQTCIRWRNIDLKPQGKTNSVFPFRAQQYHKAKHHAVFDTCLYRAKGQKYKWHTAVTCTSSTHWQRHCLSHVRQDCKTSGQKHSSKRRRTHRWHGHPDQSDAPRTVTVTLFQNEVKPERRFI